MTKRKSLRRREADVKINERKYSPKDHHPLLLAHTQTHTVAETPVSY